MDLTTKYLGFTLPHPFPRSCAVRHQPCYARRMSETWNESVGAEADRETLHAAADLNRPERP